MEINKTDSNKKVESAHFAAFEIHQGKIVDAHVHMNFDGDHGVWFELSDGSTWATSGFGKPTSLFWHINDEIRITKNPAGNCVAENLTRRSKEFDIKPTNWVPPHRR